MRQAQHNRLANFTGEAAFRSSSVFRTNYHFSSNPGFQLSGDCSIACTDNDGKATNASKSCDDGKQCKCDCNGTNGAANCWCS